MYKGEIKNWFHPEDYPEMFVIRELDEDLFRSSTKDATSVDFYELSLEDKSSLKERFENIIKPMANRVRAIYIVFIIIDGGITRDEYTDIRRQFYEVLDDMPPEIFASRSVIIDYNKKRSNKVILYIAYK